MATEANSGSFSSTNQPARRGPGRQKGVRNKKTIAQEAFKRLNYNPIETQIAMVKMYKDMLDRKVGWEGDPITPKQIEAFCTQLAVLNKDLMTYQSSKASNETEIEYEDVPDAPVSPDAPLSPQELLSTKRDMVERAQKSLEDKLG